MTMVIDDQKLEKKTFYRKSLIKICPSILLGQLQSFVTIPWRWRCKGQHWRQDDGPRSSRDRPDKHNDNSDNKVSVRGVRQ